MIPGRAVVDLGIPANELTVEERNLLSVGYKNMMSVRRTAWRTVQQYHEKNVSPLTPSLAHSCPCRSRMARIER